MPSDIDKSIVSDEDIKNFFEYSEQGKHKNKILNYGMDGFNALIQGKRWRGIHVHELYEQGILSGDVPYYVLLGGLCGKKKWWQFWKSPHDPMPRSVVDFLKREMFKGKDAELIERVYQEISSR